MLDSSHVAVRHSVVARLRIPRCWPLLLLAMAGCRAAPYRAADLPAQMRVPPTVNADQINLDNMAGLGSNTSLIGPGDLVEITISSGGDRTKAEPILARVSENGSLNVPLIGEVPVAGVEPFEAGERIAAASVERGIYRQPAVVIKVSEPAVNRVTVLGAVIRPGVQKLPRGASDVVSAIASAGGFTKEASTKVEIMRQRVPNFMAEAAAAQGVVTASYSESASVATTPSEEVGVANAPQRASSNLLSYRLDLAQANPTRRADYRVGDGDVVMVMPEKDRVIHVVGLVNRPDQFKIPRNQDVHVLDAIAMAGGIKSPVADKVFVIRRVADKSEPVVIQVSVAEAKRNGNENLRLTAGDLVSVEATPATYFVDTVTQFFNVGLGLGGSVPLF